MNTHPTVFDTREVQTMIDALSDKIQKLKASPSMIDAVEEDYLRAFVERLQVIAAKSGIKLDERRCKQCQTWTNRQFQFCVPCELQYRTLGRWCDVHGATFGDCCPPKDPAPARPAVDREQPDAIASQLNALLAPAFLSPHEVCELINTAEGRTFVVEFIKRTDGMRRQMVARVTYADKSGLKYDPACHSLVLVHDVEKDAPRMVPIDSVLSFQYREF